MQNLVIYVKIFIKKGIISHLKNKIIATRTWEINIKEQRNGRYQSHQAQAPVKQTETRTEKKIHQEKC